MEQAEVLLELENVTLDFQTTAGLLHAVRGVSFQLHRGETLAIVGESGSGKSVTARAVVGLMASNEIVQGGKILYHYTENGETKTVDFLQIGKRELKRRFCGKHVAMVFQDPMAALNPVLTIGDQLTEGMRKHLKLTRSQAYQKALELLDEVGIPNPRLTLKNYPHQLSGGMRQRVVIAIALACDPDILICDEPTTALDVTIQAQVLDLVSELKVKKNTSMILITHDLGVVAETCDNVAVVYAGEIVEYGTLEEIFDCPAHPYTVGLFDALPSMAGSVARLKPIFGMPPDPTALPAGCHFHPRCPYATEECSKGDIPYMSLGGTHICKCRNIEILPESEG